MSASFTAAGFSCCVQWPTPGRVMLSRRFGTFCLSACTPAPANKSTGSRSPVINRAGTVTYKVEAMDSRQMAHNLFELWRHGEL